MCTNTHIFCAFPYLVLPQWRNQCMTLMQAFTTPDDPPLGETQGGVLRLSHEGISFHQAPRIVIRNSIVDPVTGSIGIRFLDRSWDDHDGDCLHPECIDVTLHKQSPVDVSPITVRRHTVITRVNEPLCQEYWCRSIFWDSLADGYARGLFTHRCDHSYPDTAICHNKQSAIVKFTIDATQDYCVVTLCRFFFPLPVEWERHRCSRGFPDNYRRCWQVYFDCIRGKAWHIRLMGKDNMLLDVLDVE